MPLEKNPRSLLGDITFLPRATSPKPIHMGVVVDMGNYIQVGNNGTAPEAIFVVCSLFNLAKHVFWVG